MVTNPTQAQRLAAALLCLATSGKISQWCHEGDNNYRFCRIHWGDKGWTIGANSWERDAFFISTFSVKNNGNDIENFGNNIDIGQNENVASFLVSQLLSFPAERWKFDHPQLTPVEGPFPRDVASLIRALERWAEDSPIPVLVEGDFEW